MIFPFTGDFIFEKLKLSLFSSKPIFSFLILYSLCAICCWFWRSNIFTLSKLSCVIIFWFLRFIAFNDFEVLRDNCFFKRSKVCCSYFNSAEIRLIFLTIFFELSLNNSSFFFTLSPILK